jgi:hypothetical protein
MTPKTESFIDFESNQDSKEVEQHKQHIGVPRLSTYATGY